MAKRRVFDLMLLLQISVGIFFLVSGILGILDYNSTENSIREFFGGNAIFSLIVGILMILAGIAIIAVLFLPVKSKNVHLALWTVLILWFVTILFNDILGVNFSKMNPFDKKTDLGLENAFIALFTWLRNLSVDCLVLASIFIVKKRGSV